MPSQPSAPISGSSGSASMSQSPSNHVSEVKPLQPQAQTFRPSGVSLAPHASRPTPPAGSTSSLPAGGSAPTSRPTLPPRIVSSGLPGGGLTPQQRRALTQLGPGVNPRAAAASTGANGARPAAAGPPGSNAPIRPIPRAGASPVQRPTAPAAAGTAAAPISSAANPAIASQRTGILPASKAATSSPAAVKPSLSSSPLTSTSASQSQPAKPPQAKKRKKDSSDDGEDKNGPAMDSSNGRDSKRDKKAESKAADKSKKVRACVYCRRSHMVCEPQRPCSRCVKRGIEHLCLEDAKQSVAEHDGSSSSAAPTITASTSSARKAKQKEESTVGSQSSALPGSSALSRAFSADSNSTTSPNDSYVGAGDMPGLPPGMHPSWPLLPDNTKPPSQQQMASAWQAPGLGLDLAPRNATQSNDPVLLEYNDVDAGIGSTSIGVNDGNASGPSGSYVAPQRTPNGLEFDQLGSLFSLDNTSSRIGPSAQGGEFGALSDFLESLGIPSLPGGLGDIFSTNSRLNGGEAERDAIGWPQADAGKGFDGVNVKREDDEKLQEADALLSRQASKAEKYLLAAADQPTGSRDERLKRVIKAKYEAGLLKPYDYSRGYARMYRWLEKNVSPATKQAILRPLSVFRPAFRAIAQSLSDIDLVFVEEMFERLMLDYDRVFSAIHTPACLWRRTGEIYKANKEFSVLTGIPSAYLRGGRLGIYQLMSEESVVRYYQLLGSIAFDADHRSVNTTCVLRIPKNLTRDMASSSSGTLTTTPTMGAVTAVGGGAAGTGTTTPGVQVTQVEANGAAQPTDNGSAGPTPTSSPALGRRASPGGALQPLTALEPLSTGGDGTSLAHDAARSVTAAVAQEPSAAQGAGAPASSTASAAQGSGASAPATAAPIEYRQIKCCFSFTIRRDQWGIPIALVGNWIPS